MILPFWISLAWGAPEIRASLDTRLTLSWFRPQAQLAVRPGFRMALWDREDNLILSNTYLRVEADIEGSQTSLKLGSRVTFAPIALFDLSGYGGYSWDFGTFDSSVQFQSADADYGTFNAMRAANHDPSQGAYAGVGVTVKAAFGRFVPLLGADATWWGLSGETPPAFRFSRLPDLLVREKNDWVFTSNAAFLAVVPLGPLSFRLGPVVSHRTALATEDHRVRAGLMFNLAAGKQRFVHTILVQASVLDRAYRPLPPYVAYQLRWVIE